MKSDFGFLSSGVGEEEEQRAELVKKKNWLFYVMAVDLDDAFSKMLFLFVSFLVF